MHYYLIALLKSNAPLLSYGSTEECTEFEIVSIELKNTKKLGIVIKEIAKPSFPCKPCAKTEFYFLPSQIALAKFVAQYYCASYGEAFGLLVAQSRGTGSEAFSQDFCLSELSAIQTEALDFCAQRRVSLIFGDTGSGKSEIYFHAIAKAIRDDKNALFLMPEIALTPQMGKRLKKAFGASIAIWHSKVTKSQKKQILQGLMEGRIRVVAGARSALFLPLENLGQIIVDEEHDDAYKSQNRPYYNARDLALFLSKTFEIPLILGSATPSPTSYYQAKREGNLYRLKGKHFEGQNTIIFDSSDEILSLKLIQSISETLSLEKQVIIFIPTRGSFKTLICQNCAQSVDCKHCDISLSLHNEQRMMLCHYCGFSMPIPSACPNCGHKEFISHRLGTTQLKEELQSIFPEARIGIFDRDHASTPTRLKAIMHDFKNGELDILIGTQMIAKGHDYHNVALSVILEIDYLLNMPDFRCHERAFSLIYQVAGRTGRKDDGRVLIQSKNAELISRYMKDYEEFLCFELEGRKDLYPPFKRLVVLHFKDKLEEVAQEKMRVILHQLNMSIESKERVFEIVGAQKNAIAKIAGIYRYHIFLRTTQQVKTLKVLRHLLEMHGGFDIDIDPIEIV